MVLRRTPNCDVRPILIGFVYAEISFMQQMSACPESGRSGTAETTEMTVRFRPEAAGAAIC